MHNNNARLSLKLKNNIGGGRYKLLVILQLIKPGFDDRARISLAIIVFVGS